MKLKKGDNVIVITGKDRGKTGKIVKAIPKKQLVIIEGVNMKKKHRRPTRSNQKGQVIDKAMPLPVSNVMILDPRDNKPSRIGKKVIGNSSVRISKRSGTQLDK